MCGRVKLSTDFSEIRIGFRIPPERPAPNFAPSYDVAPTDNLPIVRYDPKAGERRRCLAPLDNFYEWQKTGLKDKQPYAIALTLSAIIVDRGSVM